MKIATTTEDFRYYCSDDAERIRELYRAGFRYIDLSLYDMNIHSPYMSEAWREEVQKLEDVAEELGMEFVQAHSPGGNPISSDASHVEQLVKTTVRSIEICGELGIKKIVVHTGYARGIGKDEYFFRNKKFFGNLFPVMERCGVNVLIENSTKANTGDMYFVNTGKDMREFLEYAGHPQLHACWDTGHANCEGAQYGEIMTLGEELYAIHYNDNHGKQDEHLTPYMGTMNHDEVMHALIDVGFKGFFTLECTNSLLVKDHWLTPRRKYDRDSRLIQPQLFMQRKAEELKYEIAQYILSEYGLSE